MVQALRSTTHAALALSAAISVVAGCTEELGDCDKKAAQELVYDRTGMVATKGQALMHDSCGQGTFCHSSAAKGANRHGVPADLNFDMLPSPTGVGNAVSFSDTIWKTIEDGQMPPKNFAVGDGDWLFDLERRKSAEKLPKLSTREGRAVLRNWLACGAPTVVDTHVPKWTMPAPDTRAPAAVVWSDVHKQIRGTCVDTGCHDGNATPGAIPGAIPVPFVADECVVYRWLLFSRSACGERMVLGGDPSESALVHKIEDARPACGEPMPPPSVPMTDKVAMHMSQLKTDLRSWVEAGAFAPQCGKWSEAAPRVAGLTAGVETSAPSWTNLHRDIIAPRCGTAGCHDAKTKAGELELWEACEAYRALQGSGVCGKRLVAGSPDESSLYLRMTMPEKIANDACHSVMPPTGPLPSALTDQIRAWITAGASAAGC